jgi:hypothetical protein
LLIQNETIDRWSLKRLAHFELTLARSLAGALPNKKWSFRATDSDTASSRRWRLLVFVVL